MLLWRPLSAARIEILRNMTTISLLFEIAATVSNNFSPTALTVLKPVIAPDSTCRLFFLLFPSVLIPNLFRVPEAEEKTKTFGRAGIEPGSSCSASNCSNKLSMANESYIGSIATVPRNSWFFSIHAMGRMNDCIKITSKQILRLGTKRKCLWHQSNAGVLLPIQLREVQKSNHCLNSR